MKKKVFLMALVGVALTACSNHDDVFTGKTQQEAQYEQNFVKKFGQPDPNHTWGFGKTTKSTRAAVDAINDGLGDHDDANGNDWYKSVNVPNPVTAEEADYVYNYFKKYKGVGEKVNWQRFFVQQVWKGAEELKDANGDTKTSYSSCMNRLLSGVDYSHMAEIKNFNDGTCGDQTCCEAENDGKKQPIAFHKNSSTQCFAYINSLDSKYHDNFLLLAIDVPGVGLGYYVGFDFEAHADGDNVNDKIVDADGIYVDWIVKIVPADYHAGSNGKRVFCEDLGTIGDFDFNDVVLDVVQCPGWPIDKTIITLRAAGGTLPVDIYAGEQRLGEVHELFGVPTKTMVNTRTNGAVERPIVVLEVNGNYSASDVKIVVEGKDGVKYTLDAETGKVPYKFATDLDVEWADECQDITERWPGFKAWVANENNKFWE